MSDEAHSHTAGAAGGKPPEAGSGSEGAKMVLTVAAFALISAGVLGFVYARTRPLIEQAKREEKGRAFAYILPEFDNKPLDTWRCAEPPDAPPGDACRRSLYTATRRGDVVGHALETFSTACFGPRVDLLVAATPDLAVSGVYILGHQETPGLGAKIVDGNKDWKNPGQARGKPFILQFAGKRLGEFDFRVRNDGGQVEVITASTITSRCVAEAIEEALRIIRDRAAMPGAGAPGASSAEQGGAP